MVVGKSPFVQLKTASLICVSIFSLMQTQFVGLEVNQYRITVNKWRCCFISIKMFSTLLGNHLKNSFKIYFRSIHRNLGHKTWILLALCFSEKKNGKGCCDYSLIVLEIPRNHCRHTKVCINSCFT